MANDENPFCTSEFGGAAKFLELIFTRNEQNVSVIYLAEIVGVSDPMVYIRKVHVTIYSIGKVKQDFVLLGEKEYLKRLGSAFKIKIVELDCDRYATMPEAQLKSREAEALLARITARDFLVALDIQGKVHSSEEFAKFLASRTGRSDAALVFAVGGAYGWDESVLSRANYKLSLSAMTFTHQMARLLLLEQIYRAWSIINHLPYHK